MGPTEWSRHLIFIYASLVLFFRIFQFSLSPAFIGSVHSSIKQALPGINKELAKAYGEVYYKVGLNIDLSSFFEIFLNLEVVKYLIESLAEIHPG